MQLTVLRIALVPLFFVLLAVMHPPAVGWAIMVFAVAAASDWWDGHIARKWGLVTPLGAFLDPLADKLLTSAAFVAFAWTGIIPWWMTIVVLARDLFLTLFRVRADAVHLPLTTSFFAKVKTFAQMTFILLMLAALFSVGVNFGTVLTSISRAYLQSDVPFWLMGIVTLLTFASAVMYAYDNWAVVRSLWLRRTRQETV
jgi:CDP-diacylglycerol--glycerol-3-phosphate 3-phosphatidyltransferase